MMSTKRLVPEDLDRVYFYVRYRQINPNSHKMMDYETTMNWKFEDGAKEKYANPQCQVEGKRLEVRIHIPSDEIEITEDGKAFRYCEEDVLTDVLKRRERKDTS